ncbi:DUF2169 family type VI secretion system accessory protein [Massilia scottii]|uniref:DUF2169 family type VI secretion system accessory protein n=1 Tax=Massilia scottii TaxID=3057166 RepID=UPI0027967FAD|nr:DUF2169 domain-containing protein [Massilia sp. CCM 9029]MDQ1832571.1 DUF2169 domain-containing protein [Massilia sp. CCM 9029]
MMAAVAEEEVVVADAGVCATIHNHTGVPHFWFQQSGPDGERLDVLVVRATFDFAAHGERITLAAQQRSIVAGDVYAGPVSTDPLRAVIEEDGDLVPYKPGTDILVSGRALAPGGLAHTQWVAGLRVGGLKKLLRLHGPRQFRKRLFGWRVGPALPVASVCLDYRLAYGGCIDVAAEFTGDGEVDTIRHRANPAGIGWLPSPADYKHLGRAGRAFVARWVAEQKMLDAPQIEAALDPVTHPFQRLPPEGFGPIARWCTPRVGYQGDYDAHWRSTRYPLLPDNFDARYFQNAPADMVITPHLRGDETVTMTGLLPEKTDMALSGWLPIVAARLASGGDVISVPLLDTLRFDLDRRQVSIVWRTHFDYDDPVVDIAIAVTTSGTATKPDQPVVQPLSGVDDGSGPTYRAC